MKLLEYRFPKLDRDATEGIGHVLASAFASNADGDALLVCEERPEGGQLRHRKISVHKVATVLADSIANSHSLTERPRLVTVKSLRTCRFVVVELDGVVRVRLAQDDSVPDAESWGAAACDVSELLTTTDLYDFI